MKEVTVISKRKAPKTRGRRANQGQVLRVSTPVYEALTGKKRHGKDSLDCVLRRMMNMPSRKGENPGLFECWILPSTGETFPTKAKARGKALLNAVKTKKSETPIKVREVV